MMKIKRIKKIILSKVCAPFKSQKFKAAFKIVKMCSYCTLICAAILLSFRTVFDSSESSSMRTNSSPESIVSQEPQESQDEAVADCAYCRDAR